MSDEWQLLAPINVRVTTPRFSFFMYYYVHDYNMHVEGLLPANLCLVTLLSLEQCSLFDRFHLQPLTAIPFDV